MILSRGPTVEEFLESEYWNLLIKPGLERLMRESIHRLGTVRATDPQQAYTINIREGAEQDLLRRLLDDLRPLRSK